MDIEQILYTLRDVSSFIDVFPSDLPPHSIARNCNVIIDADPQTERFSHCLVVHFRPKSSSPYYFDSYGIIQLVPEIQVSIKRNCTICDHNRSQLQGLTSNFSGKYCCPFALYMDRG